MIFNEDFLSEIKNSPLDGVIHLVKITRENLVTDPDSWHDQDYDVLLEAYALLFEIIDLRLLGINSAVFVITGKKDQDCSHIFQYLGSIEDFCIKESSKLKLQNFKMHFKGALGGGFCYEFSQGDLDRVQSLINEIRDLVSATKLLEKDHQRRLLARLEKLQSEMHKKVSDLDRFWGLIGDAGVVLGKLGNDAKPIIDRIKEIKDIVWQTQARAEELPSGISIPVLENKSEHKEASV